MGLFDRWRRPRPVAAGTATSVVVVRDESADVLRQAERSGGT